MFNSLQGKRIAIYARYSSVMQREASIDDQVRLCSDYIHRNGGDVRADLVFADKAVSGTTIVRADLERLLNHVRQGKVDAVVTEDMSRLSRDIADSAALFKELEYRGVRLLGVSDGIDTTRKGAKLAFTLKSLMSDAYIDDLREKTMRGLEGRALAGFSTGGLPTGYRSEPVKGPDGKLVGHRILIDEERADTVLRIFGLYAGGLSYDAIAKMFNAEKVPPPRRGAYRRKGWVASTVREMLHNRAYIGEWRFKQKQWLRPPGQKGRRYRKRAAEDVILRTYPERRIIPQELWDAVHERLASVGRGRMRRDQRPRDQRIISGKQNHYVLSGLLRCAVCNAPMIIHGGSSVGYYRCSDNKKRGTCANLLALREDVAREKILGRLYAMLKSPAAILRMRKRVVERLAQEARGMNAELEERRARLARTEEKIARLVEFISEGQHSDYVVKSLRDLEAQAASEKKEIARLKEETAKPVDLPGPDFFVKRAQALEEMLAKDPLGGREQLHRLFEGGQLKLYPQLTGSYVADGQFYPLGILGLQLVTGTDGAQTTKAPPKRGPHANLDSWSSDGCAGRI